VPALIGMGAMSIFMLASVGDVYRTNQDHVYTRDRYEIAYEMMDWLSEHDQSEYYVSNLLNWHAATISNQLRYIDGWYGFFFHPPKDHALNDRPVIARPKYVVLGNDKTPEDPTAIVTRAFETHTIYELPESLPFAFTVSDDQLSGVSTDQELKHRDVNALPVMVEGPNRMRIRARGEPEATLVTMVAYYPGWKVSVDGRSTRLRNVGGYLAAGLTPGEHTYEFAFSPSSFFLGLGVSSASLVITLGILARDLEILSGLSHGLRIPDFELPRIELPSRQRGGESPSVRSDAPRAAPRRSPAVKPVPAGRTEGTIRVRPGKSARVIVRVDSETDVVLTVSVEPADRSPD
jgi:hypothetical protein